MSATNNIIAKRYAEKIAGEILKDIDLSALLAENNQLRARLAAADDEVKQVVKGNRELTAEIELAKREYSSLLKTSLELERQLSAAEKLAEAVEERLPVAGAFGYILSARIVQTLADFRKAGNEK